MTKTRPNILITGCGGHFMKETLDCYNGHNLYGAASIPTDGIGERLKAYFKSPVCTDAGYLDFLLEVCKYHKIDFLVPTLDGELCLLYENKAKFDAIGTILSLNCNDSLYTVTDKAQFIDFLAKNNLPHPVTYCFYGAEELKKAAELFGYPDKRFCIKARTSAGSRGFRIVDENIDYMDMLLNEKPTSRYTTLNALTEIIGARTDVSMLAQEFIDGEEYSVDLVAINGEIWSIVGRLNSIVDNSIPLESETMFHAQAYAISADIVRLLGLDGNIGIDFILKSDGSAIPIEVNARITATIALPMYAGCNLAAMQLERHFAVGTNYLNSTYPDYGVRLSRQYAAVVKR